MHIFQSEILYNLQQNLVQNLAKLQENAFVAKSSGKWQRGTQKTAFTVKNVLFLSEQ